MLEHLSDLRGAFDEMSRVLRNGGEMLHMFGPAWSCAYGHHIYEDPGDALLNFSLWQMPAHIHLLCSRQEIADHYRDAGLSREGSARGASLVLRSSDHQAACSTTTHMAIFEEDRFQIDRMEIMYNELPRDHLDRLKRAFPGRRNFTDYGGKYKLVREEVARCGRRLLLSAPSCRVLIGMGRRGAAACGRQAQGSAASAGHLAPYAPVR